MNSRFHRISVALLTALAAAGLGACSSIDARSHTKPGTDFSSYRSYSWLPVGTRSAETRSAPSSRVQANILKEVNRELRRAGLTEVATGEGQLLVSYEVMRQEKISRATIDDDYGYDASWKKSPSSDYRSAVQPGTRTTVYEQDTLLIDIVEAESRELLWRGSASTKIGALSGAVEDRVIVSRVVAKIFSDFAR